jgi:hypothetical protein
VEAFREEDEKDLLKFWTGIGANNAIDPTIAARARLDNLTRETRIARDDLLSQLSRLPRCTPPAIPAFAFWTPAVGH